MNLVRRLNLMDAIFIGLGAMIGAGIFASISPGVIAAGTGLIFGVLIAGALAYMNAATMAQLAALYPESGGTYVYGRKRLGNVWGYLAGWGFVIGKIASCTAMALTFAYYAFPDFTKLAAILAVLSLTSINYLGVKKTANTTKLILVFVLAILAIVVLSAQLGGGAQIERLAGFGENGLYGILQSAGMMFFAFAGYARLATLGEEVISPEKTIPKAIVVSLGITLFVYLAVIITTLMSVDVQILETSKSPLTLVVQSGKYSFLSPIVRMGASVACLGVLLSLLAGVSRTIYAMAINSDIPKTLSKVHPKHKTPYVAEVVIALIIIAIVSIADIRSAIGFSSFAILIYYAIANAAALTLKDEERLWPKWISILGLISCLVIAFSLPLKSITGGILLFVIGIICYWISHKKMHKEAQRKR